MANSTRLLVAHELLQLPGTGPLSTDDGASEVRSHHRLTGDCLSVAWVSVWHIYRQHS